MTCKDGRFNTGNDVCSNDLRDLNDDVIIVDGYVNSQELYVEDRLGVERLTLAGIEKKVDDSFVGIQDRADAQYSEIQDRADTQNTSIQDRADTQNTAINDRADSTIGRFEGEIDAIIKDAGGIEVVNEWGDSPEKVISQKKISEHLGQDSDGSTVIKSSGEEFTFPGEGGELALHGGEGIVVSHSNRNIKLGLDETNWGGDNWGLFAFGKGALDKATNVQHSIAIGEGSMSEAMDSRYNLGIGHETLFKVTSGARNIALGSNSLRMNTTGHGNIALGRNCLQTNTTGNHNVAVGLGSLTNVAPIGLDGKTIVNPFPSTSIEQTAVGTYALNRSLQDKNTAIGFNAGRNVTNSEGVFVGYNAGRDLDLGSHNNGYNKVSYSQTGLTLIYDGSDLYIDDTTLAPKVLVGFIIELKVKGHERQYLEVISKEGTKVSFKVEVIPSSPSYLVDVVSFANKVKTPSKRVTMIGVSAGEESNKGFNTFVGFGSGKSNTGDNNTAIGDLSLNTSEGNRNTAIGVQSLRSVSSSFNTAIGYHAGNLELSDGSNVFIGSMSGHGSPTTIHNSTCIGNSSGVSGSNQVQLGNASTTTYVYGTVQNRSDARDKADIKELDLGLDLVMKLKPSEYRWNYREWKGDKQGKRKHAGFIAQDVLKAVDSSKYAFVQDHSINGGSDVLSIGYDEFIPVLTKAIQEQQKIIEELSNEVKALKMLQ